MSLLAEGIMLFTNLLHKIKECVKLSLISKFKRVGFDNVEVVSTERD